MMTTRPEHSQCKNRDAWAYNRGSPSRYTFYKTFVKIGRWAYSEVGLFILRHYSIYRYYDITGIVHNFKIES